MSPRSTRKIVGALKTTCTSWKDFYPSDGQLILPCHYCACVWDSCGKLGCKAYPDKLHRRGACIIEGRPVESTKLHTVFGWPNLQMRRDYLKCILVYKSLHAMAPAYLLTEFRHAHQIHTYNTRHRDLLCLVPLAKTVRLSKELGEFKTKAKRHFKRC